MKLVRTLALVVGCLLLAPAVAFDAPADARLEATPSAGARKAFGIGDDVYVCAFPCWFGKCCERVPNEEEAEA